ncbi:catalase family peroxidase [Dongia rigui]|uniref:Catalase-related peroxidase n=1 Tax=Dongia rigui TaxID=940149 RepID=A0ABU5DUB2_9PROT|nr:catalase family peroxidase [Dongia rigui]MDY0870902.1 catalase family peroxidase [Dongia rigui]
MAQQSPGSPFVSLAVITGVIAIIVGAFAYTGGWLSPDRLSGAKLVEALTPPTGPALGHRRNHAKGICFTGQFEANGNGTALSKAQVFTAGQYPVIGRFNFSTPDPNASDATSRVRGLGLQISTPNGDVWRSAMIDPPIFPVATPDAFYALLQASGDKNPDAMKNFAAAHPEIAAFGAWAGSAPWIDSYAGDTFNGLNAFLFVDASGGKHAVRWSLKPQAEAKALSAEEFAKLGPNHLAEEITARVAAAPQRWTMVVTVADPSDPTADPSKAWPAERQSVELGTLTVDKIQAEADGPCRDINFDPTILPTGITVSDDPFPAARSAAYAKSFALRMSEEKNYPRGDASQEGTQP